MTGLPEYRNGGLFVDLGALVPKDESILTISHKPESEVIVEWRALTVILLVSEWAYLNLCTQLSLHPPTHPFTHTMFSQIRTWYLGWC